MPAYVVLELASSRSRAARGHSPLARAAVQRLLARHDGHVLPASPPPDAAADTPATVTIAVPDMANARALADALRATDGVATAYAKPGEELP